MNTKKPTFCFSILQECSAYANIVVYACTTDNFEHLRDTLHQYSNERRISCVNVKDYTEKDFMSVDEYIDKKINAGKNIYDPSFHHGNSN